MIERVSRYYDGPLAQTKQKYTDEYAISVFRKFPTRVSTSYSEYVWKETDTMAHLAERYGSSPKFWWGILDINPEIDDCFSIEPGTVVRIPYGK